MSTSMSEVAKSEFEYFAPQPIQNSVLRAFKREFTPVSALQHGSPIQFIVPGTDMLYLDLGKSYLFIRARIRTANNGVPGNNTVGPINYTLNSLFSNVDVELNGRSVSDSNALYPFRAYLEALLTYDSDAQNSQMRSALWYKDVGRDMNNFLMTDAAPNSGLRSRSMISAQGVEFDMVGRIHSDIFHQDRAIPGNISLKVKLVPSTDAFVLVTPAPADNQQQENFKIDIIDARLYIHTLEVSPSLAIAHEQMLQRMNAHLPIRRVTMKMVSVPARQSAVNADNIFLGEQPNRIVMAMVSDEAMAGGYQQNPFNFQHFNVNYLALYVNGEIVPNRPFQPDFTNGRYIREYAQLFDGIGALFADKGLAISREEFANGFTIFVFDLTPDQNCQSCLSPAKTGTIRIELKFANPTTATINLLLLAEYDAWIEIDKFRNIITSF